MFIIPAVGIQGWGSEWNTGISQSVPKDVDYWI